MTPLQTVMLDELEKRPNLVAHIRPFDQLVARRYSPEKIIVEKVWHRGSHAKKERFSPALSVILSRARKSLERKGLVEQVYGCATEQWKNGVLVITNVKRCERSPKRKMNIIIHCKSPLFRTNSDQAFKG